MATRTEAAQKPKILAVRPNAAIAGGELIIEGEGFSANSNPAVSIGGKHAHLVVATDGLLIVKVPDAATSGEIVVNSGESKSKAWAAHVGVQIADSLHPVANPAIDADGNIFSTFSGSRGQKSPVSIYKIDTNFISRPFVTDLMNPTGLAFDHAGLLYVSSRYEGIIYQVTPTGNMSVFVEGMGVATGIAFDSEGNLYVGDRSGTIFKISRTRQIYVFATLEPSIAAYHLAFDADDVLYVTGPTTSSFDPIHRVSRAGEVDVFYRGLGRPQGLAFDAEGRLYVAASFRGRRGIVRLRGEGDPEMFVSGPGIVGLAFGPSKDLILATQSSLYRLDIEQAGRPLL
jgi:sugar lactone lactonase YvrE